MSLRLRGLAAVAAGLVLIAAALAGAANASTDDPPTVTVTTSQPGPYTYVATSEVGVVFSTDGIEWPCDTVTFTGDLGTSDPAADITGSTWNGCDFEGLPIAVTPHHNPPWQVHAVSGYTSATDDHDIMGTVDNINADVSILGGLCTFNVTGTVDINIDEDFVEPDGSDVQQTSLDSDGLSVNGPSVGCFGTVGDGDPATLTGTFNVEVFDANGDPIADNATPINIS